MSAAPTASTNAAPRRRRRLGVALVVLAPLLLGGCTLPRFWGYRGETTQAHDEFLLYAWTFIAAIVVGTIVGGLIFWAVFRYRRRHDDEAMPRQFQYHIPLEITYTVVPVIIVLVLFGFTFVSENNVDNLAPASQTYEHVTVTAFQWGWKFDYTDQGRFVLGVQRQDPDPVGSNGVLDSCTTTAPNPEDCLGPGLVLPVGKTTMITLLSNDVIHGFYVPQFNFSRYAQPGVTKQYFDLTVKSSGVYRAQCTQLCGLYHSQMFFHVVALSPGQFQVWLRSDQLAPDKAPEPNATGSGANNGLPPAYPPGSHAGSVQPPVTTTTSATSAAVSGTTTTSAIGTTTTSATGAGAATTPGTTTSTASASLGTS